MVTFRFPNGFLFTLWKMTCFCFIYNNWKDVLKDFVFDGPLGRGKKLLGGGFLGGIWSKIGGLHSTSKVKCNKCRNSSDIQIKN